MFTSALTAPILGAEEGVPRVLVVEDDVDLRRMFRTALSFAGYEVLEAGDGLSALRLLEVTDLDGIVLDLGLPVVSGHLVLQEVVGSASTRGTPVVIVTASPGAHDLSHATCVLTKPVTPEALVRTMRRCIASPSSTEGV